jgi:hypothetical protein
MLNAKTAGRDWTGAICGDRRESAILINRHSVENNPNRT